MPNFMIWMKKKWAINWYQNLKTVEVIRVVKKWSGQAPLSIFIDQLHIQFRSTLLELFSGIIFFFILKKIPKTNFQPWFVNWMKLFVYLMFLCTISWYYRFKCRRICVSFALWQKRKGEQNKYRIAIKQN